MAKSFLDFYEGLPDWGLKNECGHLFDDSGRYVRFLASIPVAVAMLSNNCDVNGHWSCDVKQITQFERL